MEDRPAVHHALDIVAGRGELVRDPFVGDQRDAAVCEQAADRAQRLDRLRHVVHGLEHRHEVVAVGKLRVGRVAHLEVDAVVHALGLRRLASKVDRGRVEVEAVDARVRIGLGDRDARPTGPAGNVRHPRRPRAEALVHVGHRRQPLGREQVDELGPVHVALTLDEVGREVRIRHTRAGPERLEHLRQRLGHPDHHSSERCHVVDAVAVEQDLVVAGRDPVAALVGCCGHVLDLEDPADRLVLQPLADVALVAARCRRDLGRGGRAAGECGVEPEPVADVDGVEVVEPEDCFEQALDERIAPVGLGARGQGATLAPHR